MTLALILILAVFSPATNSSSAVVIPDSAAQNQPSPAPSQNPPPAPAQASPPKQETPKQNPAPPAKVHHPKKKTVSADCSTSPNTAPNNSASSASTSNPAANCPPAKVIVHNGGSSEPSIQLTGGDAPHQADTATQLLGQTEANLKKVDAGQLTPSQQETVNQIHQFVDQSKAAVAAGDAERARTLALKAQMLSEELVKPQK